MITIRQAWIGIVVLFLVMLLILVALVYWQHVTGVNTLHLLLADGGTGIPTQGC